MLEARLLTFQEFIEFEEYRRQLFCNTLCTAIKSTDPNIDTEDLEKIVKYELDQDTKEIYGGDLAIYYHKEGLI